MATFATPAHASQLGPWQQISNSAGPNIDEVGLARTPDGSLHVAWLQPGAGGAENLWQTAISPSGVFAGGATILEGWKDVMSGLA